MARAVLCVESSGKIEDRCGERYARELGNWSVYDAVDSVARRTKPVVKPMILNVDVVRWVVASVGDFWASQEVARWTAMLAQPRKYPSKIQ